MKPFWEEKSLLEMSQHEWESLCDRCGQCCLIQLEDDNGQLTTTSVVCKYYDQSCESCTVYRNRQEFVPTCLSLKPANLEEAWFAPETCTYRLLAEGKNLPDWHPLVAGNRQQMQEAGIPISGKVISEKAVHPDDLEAYAVLHKR